MSGNRNLRMEEIIFEFIPHETHKKYLPTMWAKIIPLVVLIAFKVYARPERGWVIWFLAAIMVVALARDFFLWKFRHASQKIVINDETIRLERNGQILKSIMWKDATRVFFNEMKNYNHNFAKIYSKSRAISFDNMKGDFSKFKSAVIQKVDNSKIVYGKMSFQFWWGFFY